MGCQLAIGRRMETLRRLQCLAAYALVHRALLFCRRTQSRQPPAPRGALGRGGRPEIQSGGRAGRGQRVPQPLQESHRLDQRRIYRPRGQGILAERELRQNQCHGLGGQRRARLRHTPALTASAEIDVGRMVLDQPKAGLEAWGRQSVCPGIPAQQIHRLGSFPLMAQP